MSADDRVADIGALALADTTLCELLLDVLQVVTAKRPVLTTGVAARALQAIATSQPELFPQEAGVWLYEVIEAAKDRNRLVHATAAHRCIHCGGISRYEHLGEAVDRSAAAVEHVTEVVDRLIVEGTLLAEQIVGRVNEAGFRKAREDAARTGEPQSPPTYNLRSMTFECRDCTGTGQSHVTVHAGTAHVVLPPDTDVQALIARLTGSDGEE